MWNQLVVDCLCSILCPDVAKIVLKYLKKDICSYVWFFGYVNKKIVRIDAGTRCAGYMKLKRDGDSYQLSQFWFPCKLRITPITHDELDTCKHHLKNIFGDYKQLDIE